MLLCIVYAMLFVDNVDTSVCGVKTLLYSVYNGLKYYIERVLKERVTICNLV